MENKWKKAASFAMSLALVAANSAISLSNSSTVVAKAAEANVQVIEASALSSAANEQGIDESYYDAETQTLHLKGDVRNGGEFTGLVLPDGVNAKDIKHIVADKGTVLPVDCSFLMFKLTEVETVDLKNADSSNVTNMSHMFVAYEKALDEGYYADGYIREIDLTGFNTSNVTDMSGMFFCTNVESLDLSSFDTSNVTDMSSMFTGCLRIKSLDLSNFDTSNVTNMSSMFSDWWHVADYIDISRFDTSKVTDMSYMFYFNATDPFDLTVLDTSSVTDMTCMFAWGGGEILDLSSFDTSNVTSMGEMFYMTGPETIYVGPGWTAESVCDYYMFEECYNIVGGAGTVYDPDHVGSEYAHVDGGVENPGYLTFKDPQKDESYFDAETGTLHLKGYVRNSTNGTGVILPAGVNKKDIKHIVADEDAVLPKDCNHFCYKMEDLDTVDLHNADTSNVTDMSYMFMNDNIDEEFLHEINLNNIDTSNVTTMKGMFTGAYLYNIDLSCLDTSNVTDMSDMFRCCPLIDKIDLSNLDTSNVTDMSDMFGGCLDLRSVDISSFDTSNVTNFSGMFSTCLVLSTLDISNFDTSNATDMSRMFAFCNQLKSLDLSNFDTSNVTNMTYMFHCYEIESLDLSSFDTSNVTDMSFMFNGCDFLSSLDLSSFDTSNVTDMSEMFSNCRTLETIFVGDGWSTESVISSSDMFLECENLRGGAGTEYDPEHIDVEYARIDGGKDNPGYFTDIKTDAEEDTNDVMVIPEEVMDTIDYLYSNINDPTLKSVADTAIRLFNKFFSFKIV